MKKCPECESNLQHNPHNGFWFCETEDCEVYTVHYNMKREVVRVTKAGFSPLGLSYPSPLEGGCYE